MGVAQLGARGQASSAWRGAGPAPGRAAEYKLIRCPWGAGLPSPVLAWSGLSGRSVQPQAPCPPGRAIRHQHSKAGSLDVTANEDRWDSGHSLPTTEFASDSVWQGAEPATCPEGSGKTLLLTEAQMDINDYWPREHTSQLIWAFLAGPRSRCLSGRASLIHSPLIAPEAWQDLPASPGILTDLPGDWLKSARAEDAWPGLASPSSVKPVLPRPSGFGLWLACWTVEGGPRGKLHNSDVLSLENGRAFSPRCRGSTVTSSPLQPEERFAGAAVSGAAEPQLPSVALTAGSALLMHSPCPSPAPLNQATPSRTWGALLPAERP